MPQVTGGSGRADQIRSRRGSPGIGPPSPGAGQAVQPLLTIVSTLLKMTVMNVRRLIPTAALAGPSRSACPPSPPAPPPARRTRKEDGKLQVTRPSTRWNSWPQQIGGEHVAVTDLTKPGVEPHDLELTPQQTGQLGESDCDRLPQGPAARRGRRRRAVRRASTSSTPPPSPPGEPRHRGRTATHHTTGDNARARPRTRRGSRPAHLARPGEVRRGRQGRRQGPRAGRPGPRGRLPEEHRRAGRRSWTRLDKDFRDGLRNRATDTFITTHAAFGYLAERYGLAEEAITGIDPESEPSAARMKELHDPRDAGAVTTVFFETLASDRTAKTLAGDLRTADRRARPARGHHGEVPGHGLLRGAASQPRRAAEGARREVTAHRRPRRDGGHQLQTAGPSRSSPCAAPPPRSAPGPCCAAST